MKFKQPDDRRDNSTERTITRIWALREDDYDGEMPYGYRDSTLRNVRTITSGMLQTRFQKGYGDNGGKFYLSWGFSRKLVGEDSSGDEILLRRFRDAWQATGIRMEVGDPYLVSLLGMSRKRYSKRLHRHADIYMWREWQAAVLADNRPSSTPRGSHSRTKSLASLASRNIGEMPLLTSDWWEDLKNPDVSFVLWVSSVSAPDPELEEAVEKFDKYKDELEKAAEKWGVSTKGYVPPTREQLLYKEERYRNRLGGY